MLYKTRVNGQEWFVLIEGRFMYAMNEERDDWTTDPEPYDEDAHNYDQIAKYMGCDERDIDFITDDLRKAQTIWLVKTKQLSLASGFDRLMYL